MSAKLECLAPSFHVPHFDNALVVGRDNLAERLVVATRSDWVGVTELHYVTRVGCGGG